MKLSVLSVVFALASAYALPEYASYKPYDPDGSKAESDAASPGCSDSRGSPDYSSGSSGSSGWSTPSTDHKWKAPGPGDGAYFHMDNSLTGYVDKKSARGPCPMLNTLANHNYFPHNGRHITKEIAIKGFMEALNFDSPFSTLIFRPAVVVNPLPNATWFSLDMLSKHNILEHDASLSRLDAYFGNNHAFNPEVFNSSKRYWTDEIMNATMLASSKVFRQLESRAFNPTYRFTSLTDAFSVGEVSAPIVAFGDLETGTVRRDFVEYFFENERLPSELGWTKKEVPVTFENVTRMGVLVSNATNLLSDKTPLGEIITEIGDGNSVPLPPGIGPAPGGSPGGSRSRIRDLHAGLA
ncbi:heme-thiolate peroxidase [Fusarium decemcellulare]|uniref:Heme-thiolate peroxidase n=1 Tax=Fusarium decemcellulare TaxID=57161 RepID=A0ACC1SE43_9HYPO|nr:heme-thiolate peroxidase [Fusarium decemcellulare]